MGITRNLIFGNTVYQSENQVARERSVYSRFTNHYSLSNPNPASSEVTIELTHSEKPVLVRIVNMLGVEVVKRNITLSNGAAKLDVSGLSNGMYYIVVYINNENIEQQRLVISK
ncbi:MAG: T9SS type A sorting domain-containing protein [Bacteroidota bacterium]